MFEQIHAKDGEIRQLKSEIQNVQFEHDQAVKQIKMSHKNAIDEIDRKVRTALEVKDKNIQELQDALENAEVSLEWYKKKLEKRL